MKAKTVLSLDVLYFGAIAVACWLPDDRTILRTSVCLLSAFFIKRLERRCSMAEANEIMEVVVKEKWDAQMSLVRREFLVSEMMKNEGPPAAPNSAAAPWKS